MARKSRKYPESTLPISKDEEDVLSAIYRQLKANVNEHYITNSAYKQQVQEYTSQIVDLTEHKAAAWINAMEHYEKYVQEKSARKNFAQYKTLQTKQKKFLFRQQNAKLPMKSNTPGSESFFLPAVKIFRSAKL